MCTDGVWEARPSMFCALQGVAQFRHRESRCHVVASEDKAFGTDRSVAGGSVWTGLPAGQSACDPQAAFDPVAPKTLRAMNQVLETEVFTPFQTFGAAARMPQLHYQ